MLSDLLECRLLKNVWNRELKMKTVTFLSVDEPWIDGWCQLWVEATAPPCASSTLWKFPQHQKLFPFYCALINNSRFMLEAVCLTRGVVRSESRSLAAPQPVKHSDNPEANTGSLISAHSRPSKTDRRGHCWTGRMKARAAAVCGLRRDEHQMWWAAWNCFDEAGAKRTGGTCSHRSAASSLFVSEAALRSRCSSFTLTGEQRAPVISHFY